jgi:hypothetical protein
MARLFFEVVLKYYNFYIFQISMHMQFIGAWF